METGITFSQAFTAVSDTGTRTSTMAMPIDPRRELTFRTRIELVKKSRWLSNNLGLYKRFINGTARYAVGGGISHVPATRDTVWNELADAYFNNWASNEILCDVRGRVTFWRMQKYVLRSMIRDGDSFVLKTGAGIETLPSGRKIMVLPQLQWLESTAIANGRGFAALNDIDDEGFREGIRSSAQSKALAYKILQDTDPRRFDQGRTVTVPADAIRHVFDSERASSIRGLPWGYHGMNSALDILDLTSLEKVATKLHAAMAAAISRRNGDSGPKGFAGDLTRNVTTNAAGQKKIVAFENFAGGAGILQLDLDEKFELLTSNRPSTTFTGFIDFLVRDMAWGFGVPPEFIWSVAGLGGPNSRVILEDAKWFFEEVQDLLVDLLCRPIYTWVISRAVLRGELPECTDPEWWACHWQGPAKITIDQGHEGQLELERLASGCGTWEEFWAARGKTGKKMVYRRIDEIADAMDYAGKKKVPFEYVMSMKPGTPGAALDDHLNRQSDDQRRRADEQGASGPAKRSSSDSKE